MIVIDNSVAVKWVVAEEGSDAATALYGEDLTAPDLLAIEFANVLRTKVAKSEILPQQARHALQFLGLPLPSLEPSPPLIARALDIAIDLGHSVYDCVYLALAERNEAQLVTADRRMVLRVQGTPYATLVRGL